MDTADWMMLMITNELHFRQNKSTNKKEIDALWYRIQNLWCMYSVKEFCVIDAMQV